MTDSTMPDPNDYACDQAWASISAAMVAVERGNRADSRKVAEVFVEAGLAELVPEMGREAVISLLDRLAAEIARGDSDRRVTNTRWSVVPFAEFARRRRETRSPQLSEAS